jgi:SulP family sulfate permease
LSQLKHLLGIDLPRGSALATLLHAFTHAAAFNPWSVGVGAASYFSLKALKLLNKKAFPRIRLPEQLVVVIASALFAYATAIMGNPRMPIVGRVPVGLPSPRYPGAGGDRELFLALVRPALLVAFFSYVVTMSVAKPFSLKHGYKVDPNQVNTHALLAASPCHHRPVPFFFHVVTMSVAKPFSLKHGYKVDPNQAYVKSPSPPSPARL